MSSSMLADPFAYAVSSSCWFEETEQTLSSCVIMSAEFKDGREQGGI